MAFFFGDGFDLYSAITDCGTYWDAAFGSGATLALSSSGRFAGSRGLTTTSGSVVTTPYITKTSSVNDPVHHFSFAAQLGTPTGTLTSLWIALYDGTSVQCCVFVRSDGSIVLSSGAEGQGTILATYTGAFAAPNTWYQFEVEIVVNNTTGSFTVRKLGNTTNDFSATGLNTRNGSTNNYANKIGLGCGNSTPVFTADDFLWRSDATSGVGNAAWLGDIRCYTRMPASDASVSWSRLATFPLSPFGAAATTAQAISANIARYVGFTSQGGSIGSVTITLQAAITGNMKCAIFACTASTLGTGVGAILGVATASIANPVAGVNTFTFSPAVTIAQGTLFYVGFCSDTTLSGGCLASNTASSSSYTAGATSSTTYASFPVASPTLNSTNVPNYNASPIVTPTGNYNEVADPQQDGANSYVSSSTVGQSDLYGIQPISATPGSIVGVTTRAYMEKSDAGTRIAAAQLQSGAANVQASLTLNTTWGWAYRNDLVDPNTGIAWTATGVNNAQIGCVVTA